MEIISDGKTTYKWALGMAALFFLIALWRRLAGISLLSSLKAEIGDMNRVKRFVQVTGMVNADSSFTQHSQVINGFSDLMVEIFREDGKHVRAAVGMSSLPFNMAVEIMAVVELTD